MSDRRSVAKVMVAPYRKAAKKQKSGMLEAISKRCLFEYLNSLIAHAFRPISETTSRHVDRAHWLHWLSAASVAVVCLRPARPEGVNDSAGHHFSSVQNRGEASRVGTR